MDKHNSLQDDQQYCIKTHGVQGTQQIMSLNAWMRSDRSRAGRYYNYQKGQPYGAGANNVEIFTRVPLKNMMPASVPLKSSSLSLCHRQTLSRPPHHSVLFSPNGVKQRNQMTLLPLDLRAHLVKFVFFCAIRRAAIRAQGRGRCSGEARCGRRGEGADRAAVMVKERIARALRLYKEAAGGGGSGGGWMVQVWAPPFVLASQCHRLFQYRTVSLTRVFPVGGAAAADKQGLPARAFDTGTPEWTPNVQCYGSGEYARISYALIYDIQGSLFLPILDPDDASSPLAVHELVSTVLRLRGSGEVQGLLAVNQIVNPDETRAAMAELTSCHWHANMGEMQERRKRHGEGRADDRRRTVPPRRRRRRAKEVVGRQLEGWPVALSARLGGDGCDEGRGGQRGGAGVQQLGHARLGVGWE
uniref:Uncharacterized protein n=1 Tax=Oryza rufipogon TaxID=4529 RepID=A0A0E0PIK0_ORYRU